MNCMVTLHDAPPEMALAALGSHQGPVLLDLDETLYCRNSTEDFIDSARPSIVAALLLRLLDLAKPWRWTGGEATRDIWRVRTVDLLLPWTARNWRARVPQLAARFTNQELAQAARQRAAPPIITTIGFEHIVTPLISAMGFAGSPIVAADIGRWSDRRDGKLKLALRALGDETVRTGLVITDSSQDLPLLDACARPLRTVWPQAQYRGAHSSVYLPGLYLSRVKHPGERYIMRGILQEDFAYWVLSSIGLSALPVFHFLGLLCLLLSFWTVYEQGYVDNDRAGARYEKNPKLSPAFHQGLVATPRWTPWLWALGAGAAGLALLHWPARLEAKDLARWLAVLLATHGWFRLYNRVDKSTRVWMYAGLQVARSTAFIAVVAVGLPGAIALASHVMVRWMPYFVYRLSGREWPEAPICLARLLFLLILSGVVAAATGPAPFLGPTALALLAWTLYRARTELRNMLASAHLISRKETA